jgi:hypothetical protein
MDNQIPEDPYRILARERSHEDARQTVATNRMLVQSLVIINGGAATAVLAYYGTHNASGPGKLAFFTPPPKAAKRVLGFFTAQISNDHTRRAYMNAARRFADWCRVPDINTPTCP